MGGLAAAEDLQHGFGQPFVQALRAVALEMEQREFQTEADRPGTGPREGEETA